jgi:hypothetical protein
MEPLTFDRWVAGLGHRRTRRTSLRLLGGALFGGVLAGRENERARAAQLDIAGPPDDVSIYTCAGGGLATCGDVCVDTATDAYNCGGCGVVCGPGWSCINGLCLGAAPPSDVSLIDCAAQGQVDCGGFCTDVAVDAFNCGVCGNPCPLGGFCEGGVCKGTVCLGSETDCGGYCADLLNDPANCGFCHNFCDSGTCSGGGCAPICFGGGSVCTDDSECCSGDCGLDEVFGGGVCV